MFHKSKPRSPPPLSVFQAICPFYSSSPKIGKTENVKKHCELFKRDCSRRHRFFVVFSVHTVVKLLSDETLYPIHYQAVSVGKIPRSPPFLLIRAGRTPYIKVTTSVTWCGYSAQSTQFHTPTLLRSACLPSPVPRLWSTRCGTTVLYGTVLQIRSSGTTICGKRGGQGGPGPGAQQCIIHGIFYPKARLSCGGGGMVWLG